MPDTQHQTHRLHLAQQDAQSNPYHLVPFEVPDGTTRIDVQYEHTSISEPSGVKNIVDLGLFDPRGSSFLTAKGFRGWSGSARAQVTIAPSEATPGYLPGPIYPGTWHVCLGLYQIAPEGCAVTVTVTLSDASVADEAPPAYVSPGVVRDGPAWYRGDLHCHSHHSDAQAEVGTLAAVARAQGLDFVAVTDHNTVSHLPALARHSGPDLLLIPGIEITTYRGHANAWGIRRWQEFRATTDAQIRQIRAHVREQGALFSINHPKYSGPNWEFDTDADADAVEGWQAPWWFSNYESLAFWENLLRQGKRPTLVGGSDKHQKAFDGTLGAYELGTPTTWVHAENLSERAILDGIGAGHVFVSQGPKGPRLELTARAGERTAMMGDMLTISDKMAISDETAASDPELISLTCRVWDATPGWMLRVLHQDGEAHRVPIDSPDFCHTWQAAAEDDYWYVQVIESTQVPLDRDPVALYAFALSNPIYIRIKR